jgi:hypothetical protein
MVIDGDAHCNEPKDLFDRFLEKEFRDCGQEQWTPAECAGW